MIGMKERMAINVFKRVNTEHKLAWWPGNRDWNAEHGCKIQIEPLNSLIGLQYRTRKCKVINSELIQQIYVHKGSFPAGRCRAGNSTRSIYTRSPLRPPVYTEHIYRLHRTQAHSIVLSSFCPTSANSPTTGDCMSDPDDKELAAQATQPPPVSANSGTCCAMQLVGKPPSRLFRRAYTNPNRYKTICRYACRTRGET